MTEVYKEITFVFTVVCAEADLSKCSFFNDENLDNFHKVKDAIVEKLNGEYDKARVADPDLLLLKQLTIYAGQLLPEQLTPENFKTLRELPSDNNSRYGRVLFTGIASGDNVFTESLEQLEMNIDNQVQESQMVQDKINDSDAIKAQGIQKAHQTMKEWSVKFNYLLHEIFSCDRDKKGNPFIDENGNTINSYIGYDEIDPASYHPREFAKDPHNPLFDHTRDDIKHPWYAAWTIFVIGREGQPYGMVGGGAC